MTIGMFGVLLLLASIVARRLYLARVGRAMLEERLERDLRARELRMRARERRRRNRDGAA